MSTLKTLAVALLAIATLVPAKAEDLSKYLGGLATIWAYDHFCKPAYGLTPKGLESLTQALGFAPQDQAKAALDVVQKDFLSLGQEKFCTGMAPSIDPVISQINAMMH
jgi:hypothetical protein